MSNQWLRLWHDLPTDPKWRTISRISKQPISLVISVYVTLLCDASQNVTRGHADVTAEDIASQLDVTDDEIHSILDAMQDRVLEGKKLKGWDKRQPKKEDQGSESGARSAAERKRAQREREKNNQEFECHDTSRNVTTDKDKDKDKKKEIPNGISKKEIAKFTPPSIGEIRAFASDRKMPDDSERFQNFYESNGWKVGKNPMKNWQAAYAGWVARNAERGNGNGTGTRNGSSSSIENSIRYEQHMDRLIEQEFGQGVVLGAV